MSKTQQATVTMKVTKASVVSVLTLIATVLTYAVTSSPKFSLDGALIGYALGDTITFLQGSTLSDNWQYASIKVVAISVLTVVGTFVGQAVSASAISPYAGALIGYSIAEGVTLLEQPSSGASSPPPPPPTPPQPAPAAPGS